ncbi:uncharacterized protein [Procambarus clarkii]|uniref:uncharacterized protein n=1 Tax=Procambarus clarkii TaxID=6728 RepID=UPI001E676067|nr:uncharacterized protein LOC123770260 [Procambarus clarkii]
MAGTRTLPTSSSTSSLQPTTRLAKVQHKHLEGVPCTSQQATASIRPGKRRHQATVSPITARNESRSPRAKQRPVPSQQSPPTISGAPVVATATAITITSISGRQRTESCSGSVSPSQLAVPRVSAEPPCPSKLPMPPMHWMAGENKKCPAQRQRCRAVTESLVSHLTNSGILVTA